jgi:hypothetical protein
VTKSRLISYLVVGIVIESLLLTSSVSAGVPRYRSCGRVSELGVSIPVYGSQVACATAVAVERKCRRANCFGRLPMLNKDGSFFLPSSGEVKPFGFECWQVYGGYTAGLPAIPRAHEASWILCGRLAGNRSATVIYTQFVAYWSQ